MKNSNRYVTGLILTAAIVVLSGIFFLQGISSTVRSVVADELSYNMPRPRSALYNFFFGLDGREVQRKEINPFKDKESKTTAGAGSVRKPGDKKAAATAKTAAQTQAAKTAAQAPKKPEVKVNVIPKDTPKSISSAEGTGRAGESMAAAPYAHRQGDSSNTGFAKEQKNAGLSSGQWRSLLSAQPTKENVAKLIKAFNEKEVDAATLYTIMDDLASSSNPETQAQALLIAQEIPSLRSFSVISNNYEKFDPAVKKSADTYFLTYMHPSRLGILAMALQSDDTEIVHRAAQVMVVGLQSTTTPPQGDVDSLSRPGRGTVTPPKKSQFAQFIPLFQNLERNPDSTISGLAQNALGQLQALSNT